jgi:hypothetical protein
MQENKDTEFYPVVSAICRSALIHVAVDFKLSLAPLSLTAAGSRCCSPSRMAHSQAESPDERSIQTLVISLACSSCQFYSARTWQNWESGVCPADSCRMEGGDSFRWAPVSGQWRLPAPSAILGPLNTAFSLSFFSHDFDYRK